MCATRSIDFLFPISTVINELNDDRARMMSIMIAAFILIELIKASYEKEVLPHLYVFAQ